MKSLWIYFLLIIATTFASCSKNWSSVFDQAKEACDNSKDLDEQAIPAKKCAAWFPVATTKEITKIVNKPGKLIELPGKVITRYVNCDSAVKAAGAGNAKRIVVKVPEYLRVDTSAIERAVYLKDVAELDAATKKIQKQEAEILNYKVQVAQKDIKITEYKKWMIAGWAGFIFFLLVIIVYIITKLGPKKALV